LKINFNNYPKFPLEERLLKSVKIDFTKMLMQKFEQNKLVIAYLDDTSMFEVTNDNGLRT